MDEMKLITSIEEIESFTGLAADVGAWVGSHRDMQTLDVVRAFADLCDVLGMPWPAWMMEWEHPGLEPARLLFA